MAGSLAGALLLLPILAGAPKAAAQDQSDPELPSILRENPNLPGIGSHLRGLNAGVSFAGVHDSDTGWATLMVPEVLYSFSQRFSADISMPVYLYHLADHRTSAYDPASPGQAPGQSPGYEPSEEAGGQPSLQRANRSGDDARHTQTGLLPRTMDPADLVIAAHAVFGQRFTEILTPAISVPTGDSSDGLSTGRVTFDLDSRSQLAIKNSALVVDLGAGDSSDLLDRPITSDYTSLGSLAHFQLGLLLPLLFRGSFQSVAYEQLPLGDNKIYTTISRRGYPDLTVVKGRTVTEDNGFLNSLVVPLSSHIALNGYYDRSLRLHLDTVGMGISFAWRRTRPRWQQVR